MTTYSGPQQYPCNWKKRRIPSSTWVYGAMCIVMSGIAFINDGNLTFALIAIIFLLFMIWLDTWLFVKLKSRSHYTITDDGFIEVSYYRRKIVRFPITEITRIKDATRDESNQRECRRANYPVVFSRGADDIMPTTGVLIWFNRNWSKSVMPYFFHPADPDGFISTLCQLNPLIVTDQNRTPKISVSDSIELKNT